MDTLVFEVKALGKTWPEVCRRWIEGVVGLSGNIVGKFWCAGAHRAVSNGQRTARTMRRAGRTGRCGHQRCGHTQAASAERRPVSARIRRRHRRRALASNPSMQANDMATAKPSLVRGRDLGKEPETAVLAQLGFVAGGRYTLQFGFIFAPMDCARRFLIMIAQARIARDGSSGASCCSSAHPTMRYAACSRLRRSTSGFGAGTHQWLCSLLPASLFLVLERTQRDMT